VFDLFTMHLNSKLNIESIKYSSTSTSLGQLAFMRLSKLTKYFLKRRESKNVYKSAS
jgi:hypothetical protein